MEKLVEQKYKDYLRKKDKIWVDEPQTLKKRTCSGGVRFGGSCVDKGGVKKWLTSKDS